MSNYKAIWKWSIVFHQTNYLSWILGFFFFFLYLIYLGSILPSILSLIYNTWSFISVMLKKKKKSELCGKKSTGCLIREKIKESFKKIYITSNVGTGIHRLFWANFQHYLFGYLDNYNRYSFAFLTLHNRNLVKYII